MTSKANINDKNSRPHDGPQADALNQEKNAALGVHNEASGLRRFGIDLVGDIPWGTHLCQFYQTKKDLTDILVPYFAEGLRNNEFCMWVTSPPLEVEQAKKALAKAVSNLDQYVKKGQIEILSYKDWYLLGGKLDADDVLQAWTEKEKKALDQGFEGLRATGNTLWIERKNWKSFADYEAMVNNVIRSHKMIALCTYALKKCNGSDIVDVMRNHIGTLIRRSDTWCLLEDVVKRRTAEEEVLEGKAKYRSLFDNMVDGFAYHKVLFNENGKPVDYVFLEVNEAFERLTGLEKEKVVGRKVTEVLPGIEKDPADWIGIFGRVATTGEPVRFENYSEQLRKWYLASAFSAERGYFAVTFEDITKRRLAEDALTKQRNTLQAIMENTGTMLAYLDPQFNFLAVNSAYAKRSRHSAKELIGKNHFAFFPNTENQAIFENVRDTGESVTFFDKPFEFASQPEAGITYWDWTLAPVKDQAGRVQGLVLSLMETTERKKAEEEIRVLSRFPTENPHPVMRLSKDGKILYGNPASLPLLDQWKCQIGQLAPEELCQKVADAYSSALKKELEVGVTDKTFSFLLVPITDAGYVNVYGRDITERKKAEEKLLLAKNEWERTFDSMPDLVAILDNEHRIVRANKSMVQRLGMNLSQCIGLNCFKYVHKLDEPPSYCPHSLTMADGKEHIAEVHEDNLGGDFLVSTTPLVDHEGRVVGSVHVARDITEFKRAEQSLRESHANLNHAQAVAKTGSWQLDVRRNELLWSDETHRMFGIPKGTPMTYETFLGTVHPDDREYVDQKWKAALRGEPYDIEHRIIIDGEMKWVRERAELEFNADGSLLGGFGTVQEITERKQLEEKLFQSERKYRTLYETSLDGIVSADMDGHIIECNDAYAHMLGYSKDELRKMTYHQFTPEKWHEMEDEIVKEQVVKRGHSNLYEKEYMRQDGSIVPVSLRIWLVRDEKWRPVGMWGIVRDITQTKQLENELKRHSEHLERLVEERTRKLREAERLATIGETAAMVGHDIRNPLQSIEGAVYLAKEELKSLPAQSEEKRELQEILDIIGNQTTYIDGIIADLQDFARTPLPQPKETDIQQLISDTLSMMEIPENIEVHTMIQEETLKLTVDPIFTRRVLLNLIENAVQAMPRGGQLRVKAFTDAQSLYIFVEDTGEGIPEDNKPKMFTPLFTTKAKGQGFGLPVCRKLIESLNGEITFESQLGKGTTFKVKLPLSPR